MQASFALDILDSGNINGFAGFFDVQFRGSPENPADFDVLLSTAPDPTGATHWGQQTFTLHPPVECVRGGAFPYVLVNLAIQASWWLCLPSP